MPRLRSRIVDLINNEINVTSIRLNAVTKRYGQTLAELDNQVNAARANVLHALERMGYSC